ncbi:Sec-independent protein translocase TatA [Anaerobranca californiensis DSM 14826]|jgi:sec-independent protein translocase protein TatA|uniref:Sec-independent protein translocase protein TatA n=1 Tax=Anaerobranca californiensis DSM 14826 TaxID=1120989 RepID=A0A1M6QUH1_9FIRM|nr:twin-arginine translocase TatA/TatE family subunit [Anaerobranca californiensis]SHK23874.1 Sec-independent protein translocase TatA [Anaerobranca californiensis DSM 14826]
MPKIGGTELIVILVVILLIFGPSKLPEIGKSFGKSIKEFRKASKDIQDSITDEEN